MRLASALALVAVFLRLVLPLLHTHDHHHLPASASADGAAVTLCTCGAVHATPDRGPADGEQVDAAPEEHHCLACELEEGTPCGVPPVAECPPPGHAFAAQSAHAAIEVLAASQVRLAQPRAPPGPQA